MSKKFFIIIPYRDHEFYLRYGNAVRDLQIISTLFKDLDNKIIINRPSLPFEIWRIIKLRKFTFENYQTFSSINFNLHHLMLGKRETVARSYDKIVNKIIKDKLRHKKVDEIIILDFHPYALIKKKDFWCNRVHYWHDMIDNFVKHNRFSKRDKALVRRKYMGLTEICGYLSGVTAAALNEIDIIGEKAVIPNGVYFENQVTKASVNLNKNIIGFIGFVTDKFDVEIVRRLRKMNFNIIIWGAILDKSVGKILAELGCELAGEFSYNQINSVMQTFSIGLIPYLKQKSHDGSPLKLYEYLKYNKCSLTSMNYEYNSPFILNYTDIKNDENLYKEIKKLIDLGDSENIAQTIPDQVKLEIILKNISNLPIKL